MQALSDRTARLKDSAIGRMVRLSREVGAVNLSQGFPDFDPPAQLTRRLERVAGTGPHQYPLTWGAPNFREALARTQGARMGLDVDPQTQVVVTCGSTEALVCALMSVCDPGDRVVVFSPFYESYAADAALCGAVPTYVELHAPDFTFDPAELAAACALPGTRAVLLNDPNNPCGHVFSRAELDELARLADLHDLVVIADDVYEHLVYPPLTHTYFASLPGMEGRTVTCGSLSKTYAVTGWRLGYAIAPAPVVDRMRRVHDYLTIAAPAPLMEAATAALELPQEYYDGLNADYARRRDLFCSGLRRAGVPFVEPQGTYFVLCDFSELGYEDDMDLACDLARRVGVAGVPCSGFFARPENSYVRLHFAKSDEVLNRALGRLGGWREKMAGGAR